MASRLTFVKRQLAKEIANVVALSKFALDRHTLADRLARSFPGLSVETTNICNANCTFCAYQYQQRPTGVMSMELFERVIDQYCDVGGGPLSLTPTVGDPLVDPHIVARVKMARARPAIGSIEMTSNLIRLAHFTPGALIDAGLSALNVSTTGFDEEMYRRVYRSKMYPKVIRAIVDFAEANNAAGRPVSFTISLRVDRPLAEVLATKDHRRIEQLVGTENIGVNHFFDDWAGKILQGDLTGNMRLRGGSALRRLAFHLRRPRVSACTEMYSGPMVYWDGRVGACACRDVDASELIIGNVNQRSLAEIWFGDELRKMRADFLTPRCPEICQKCTHYNNLAYLMQPAKSDYLQAALSTERPMPGATKN